MSIKQHFGVTATTCDALRNHFAALFRELTGIEQVPEKLSGELRRRNAADLTDLCELIERLQNRFIPLDLYLTAHVPGVESDDIIITDDGRAYRYDPSVPILRTKADGPDAGNAEAA